MAWVRKLAVVWMLAALCVAGAAAQRKARLSHRGIDISHHNQGIKWDKLRDVEFVYIKASEGGTHQDDYRRQHYRDARKHGKKVGFYHYFRAGIPSAAQFNNFVSATRDFRSDLVPVIDFEVVRGDPEGVVATFDKLYERLKRYYGRAPIVYTTQHDYDRYLRRSRHRNIRTWATMSSRSLPNIVIQQTVKKHHGMKLDFNDASGAIFR